MTELANAMIDLADGVHVDFAPHILRQRLVVEGNVSQAITATQITDYLSQLSSELEMNEILAPVTHQSPMYGWAGWIHWETSGAHFYAWDEPDLFFSVDIYTCKAFSNKRAVEFTRDFFNATRITSKAF